MPEWSFPRLAHGADYNPDQWLDNPDILREDIRLMKKAKCNLMSVGIFAWTALEPEEGVYTFDWLESVLDSLGEAGISAVLATPSGARPAWMSAKYPEVLRVRADGLRDFHGARHNHCYTSPVYREQVTNMNAALARRFGNHPAVVGWHISNEYSGECHCELCQRAFRDWLKDRYKTLDALNKAWWTSFWSKTYTEWTQLRSPSSVGEKEVHGLNLAWKRFVTDSTIDFMKTEIAPIRRITPELPITTNFMGMFIGLDYPRFADAGVLDFACWDNYPRWGQDSDDDAAAILAAFNHDITRSLLRKPFLLMESTPSQVNWQEVCKLKRPGMHLLSSLQAVAHGADSVQYFQWRKSRGASEKFHGAVVGHSGHENTRVFRDAALVGDALEKLAPVRGGATPAKVALLFDWNNRWAIADAQGPRRDKQFDETALEHYAALRRLGVDVDIIDSERDFSPYAVIAAPMLYMVKPGVAARLERFVEGGGQLIATYFSGVVDQDDLCFLGGFPGPLRGLLGVWAEELDALYPGQTNVIRMRSDAPFSGDYECGFLCEIAHAETARTLAVYASDFYAGSPALTVNEYGDGQAWYIAARAGEDFLVNVYAQAVERAGAPRLLSDKPLPKGLHAASREGANGESYLFIMNFDNKSINVDLPHGVDMLTGESVGGEAIINSNSLVVLARR
ncbi:MAG: beta-galactosidase [Oscillospiraceae bacterium]|jgi:beta-galactosidase|nr:beta-galactosidase [Oscillospiraceae bacterium]